MMQQLQFRVEDTWPALTALLKDQLGLAVDVDTIGVKDFDEEGALTVRTPAARILFGVERAKAIDTQNQNYTTDQDFGVICADNDLGPDPQDQRLKSIQLSSRVKVILIGARLLLPTGETSEPIQWISTDPLPTAQTGMAYVLGFRVSGVAQFPAPNQTPTLQQPEGGL
jgi:hypothetical protein